MYLWTGINVFVGTKNQTFTILVGTKSTKNLVLIFETQDVVLMSGLQLGYGQVYGQAFIFDG